MIPRDYVVLVQSRGIDIEVLQQVLYFVAIAIKSYEAVRLLVEHDFIQDQIALAHYQLTQGEDDVVLWKMARWDPRARLLYLSGQLKPLLYMQPLLPFAPDLIQAGREMLSHLPSEEVERLEALTRTLDEHHSESTHQNVTRALAHVLEELLGPPTRDVIRTG
jgi:hypothetical protein